MPEPIPAIGNDVLRAINVDGVPFGARHALDADPSDHRTSTDFDCARQYDLYALAEEWGHQFLDSAFDRFGKHVDDGDGVGHFNDAPVL